MTHHLHSNPATDPTNPDLQPNNNADNDADNKPTLSQFISQLDDDKPNQQRQIPPLERWQPKPSGTMNMTIKANGEWWHEGQKVTRQSLVDLFAKVLWVEVQPDNTVQYFLKSPVEKWQIQVEDAPLLVTKVETVEEAGKVYLQFTTQHGDIVRADDSHPLRFGLPFHVADDDLAAKQSGQPYLLVRQNGDSVLYALLHRNVFYHLIELGELTDNDAGTTLTLNSGDTVFNLTMPHEEANLS